MRVRYSFSSRRTRHIENIRKQRSKYPELTQKIISISDIILEVLDARFIEETRNKEIEEEIKKQNKKLIFVLNKADLVEKINTKLRPYVAISCTKKIGGRELRGLIQKIAKSLNKKTSKIIKKDKIKTTDEEKITVGVIGYPNTGKSSTINLIVGKPKTKTASIAGYTKNLQKIKLTSEIQLIDSPGVIPREEYSGEDSDALTRHTKVGGRSYSQVKDPEIVVANLMEEYPQIEKYYKINAEQNSEILLEELGRQKGFLKKGGVVNEDQTARLILKDFQSGKIKI
jgi:hypothetical protein